MKVGGTEGIFFCKEERPFLRTSAVSLPRERSSCKEAPGSLASLECSRTSAYVSKHSNTAGKNAQTGLNKDRWASDRAEIPAQTFLQVPLIQAKKAQSKKSANPFPLIGLSIERMLKIILQELAQSKQEKKKTLWVVFLSYLMWVLFQDF